MSNVFLKVLLEFSELNNSNGGAIRQRCNATTYRVTVPSLLKAEDSEKEEREVIKMKGTRYCLPTNGIRFCFII